MKQAHRYPKKTISLQQLHHILSHPNYRLIETDSTGPSVMETPNGQMLKFFRAKKDLLSSSRFNPYAVRFCKNSARLQRLGFSAPPIEELLYCPKEKTHIVNYHKLPGETAYAIAQSQDLTILDDVLRYLVELHNRGVFFRAIHLRNLLIHDQEISMIDISDVQFRKTALSLPMRYRNLQHLFLHVPCHTVWRRYGISHAITRYCELAGLSRIQAKWLTFLLRHCITNSEQADTTQDQKGTM